MLFGLFWKCLRNCSCKAVRTASSPSWRQESHSKHEVVRSGFPCIAFHRFSAKSHVKHNKVKKKTIHQNTIVKTMSYQKRHGETLQTASETPFWWTLRLPDCWGRGQQQQEPTKELGVHSIWRSGSKIPGIPPQRKTFGKGKNRPTGVEPR